MCCVRICSAITDPSSIGGIDTDYRLHYISDRMCERATVAYRMAVKYINTYVQNEPLSRVQRMAPTTTMSDDRYAGGRLSCTADGGGICEQQRQRRQRRHDDRPVGREADACTGRRHCGDE